MQCSCKRGRERGSFRRRLSAVPPLWPRCAARLRFGLSEVGSLALIRLARWAAYATRAPPSCSWPGPRRPPAARRTLGSSCSSFLTYNAFTAAGQHTDPAAPEPGRNISFGNFWNQDWAHLKTVWKNSPGASKTSRRDQSFFKMNKWVPNFLQLLPKHLWGVPFFLICVPFRKHIMQWIVRQVGVYCFCWFLNLPSLGKTSHIKCAVFIINNS